jgi:peptidoglycan hydrolase-like protein with peptidoglycan-binding domain
VRQVLAKLLGNERLERLPHGGRLVVLASAVLAAGLGPAAAIALADGGGSAGLGSATLTAVTSSTTGTTITTGTVVKVTTPCSGSLGTSTTTTGPAITTVTPTTTTAVTTDTATTTEPITDTTATDPTGTDPTATDPTSTDPTATEPTVTYATVTTTTPVTTTVPAAITTTTPGTTTVTTTPPCPATTPAPSAISVPKSNPFTGRAMWIWEMHFTNGGSVASIVAQAKRYGIRAVYVKSSDGTSWWPQFSRKLVTELHEAGLKVCAWQYVYGLRPAVEANLGSRAAHDGADCLVIDAESQYQSRYQSAQTYISRLRKLIGQRYPVGLASFPYVDYHLTFPYSVFLGPGGAQYNLPQMYWADIGTSVPFIFAHTYEYNEIYRRPIYPLGQLWNSGRGMSTTSIEEFDLFAKAYGATGVSWWDWQSAPQAYFKAIDKLPALPVSYSVNKTPASIFRGNKGDLVIWAQEHLYGAGFHIAVDGQFGPLTQSAVKSFQRRHELAVTGIVNGLTWDALDKITPVTVRWTSRRNQSVAVIARKGKLAGAAQQTTLTESVPSWMKRSRSRNELHTDVGAGGSSTAKR